VGGVLLLALVVWGRLSCGGEHVYSDALLCPASVIYARDSQGVSTPECS
jgi:hypothetical protein